MEKRILLDYAYTLLTIPIKEQDRETTTCIWLEIVQGMKFVLGKYWWRFFPVQAYEPSKKTNKQTRTTFPIRTEQVSSISIYYNGSSNTTDKLIRVRDPFVNARSRIYLRFSRVPAFVKVKYKLMVKH